MTQKTLSLVLVSSLFVLSTSCLELDLVDDETPRSISGSLVWSCTDSTPVANTTLVLRYKESFFVDFDTAVTDKNGKFTFDFTARDWHEGGTSGPYYAEIEDVNRGSQIISGIKPGKSDLGIIFHDYSRHIDVRCSIDLTTLSVDDSLKVRTVGLAKFYLPGNAIIHDTLIQRVESTDINGGSQVPDDHVVKIKWWRYKSDTLHSWGTHITKLDNPCQEFVETELVFE